MSENLHMFLNVIMTLAQLISDTFLLLFPQFSLMMLEVLPVVTFFLLKRTHHCMEYVPYAITV